MRGIIRGIIAGLIWKHKIKPALLTVQNNATCIVFLLYECSTVRADYHIFRFK